MKNLTDWNGCERHYVKRWIVNKARREFAVINLESAA